MKIALVQASLIWGDVEENLHVFDQKLTKCCGCDVIVLPEMFTSGCMMVKKSREIAMAEKMRVAARYGDVRKKMLEWSAQCDALVIGSTVYKEGEHYYNRLIAAFPNGECRYYDKRHCFRMGGENEHFSAGRERLVFEFRGVKIATFICYDLRFPVWCRNTRNYDLAVFVANWPESRREVWKLLLKARAVENQSYVVGVNCVGTDENGLHYAGDSMVLDARGEMIAVAEVCREEIVVADCDMEKLHDFRRKFPVLEDGDEFNVIIC